MRGIKSQPMVTVRMTLPEREALKREAAAMRAMERPKLRPLDFAAYRGGWFSADWNFMATLGLPARRSLSRGVPGTPRQLPLNGWCRPESFS